MTSKVVIFITNPQERNSFRFISCHGYTESGNGMIRSRVPGNFANNAGKLHSTFSWELGYSGGITQKECTLRHYHQEIRTRSGKMRANRGLNISRQDLEIRVAWFPLYWHVWHVWSVLLEVNSLESKPPPNLLLNEKWAFVEREHARSKGLQKRQNTRTKQHHIVPDCIRSGNSGAKLLETMQCNSEWKG